MKLLKEYFELQKQIYDYFGYQEDWVVIPLEDSTEYYWCLGEGFYGNSVLFFEDKENLIEAIKTGNYYSNSIYHQRFLDKCVYRKDDYTMIVVDTHTDGNKFLQVLDNSKELKKEDLK